MNRWSAVRADQHRHRLPRRPLQHGDTNAYSHSDGNLYSHSNAYSNINADSYVDSNAHTYSKVYSDAAASPYPSMAPVTHAAVIRVYDDAGKVTETHERPGEFRE